MTLDQYIAELIELREKHTAGDFSVVTEFAKQPPEPKVGNSGGKWVVRV